MFFDYPHEIMQMSGSLHFLLETENKMTSVEMYNGTQHGRNKRKF